MSKTYSFSLTDPQVVELCHDLNVREIDLTKVLKYSLIKDTKSKFYNQRLVVEKKTQLSDEQIIKKSPEEKLREILGIDSKDKNVSRKFKASGIYFKKNVEDDLGLFVQFWEGNWQRVDEICILLQNHKMRELAVRELASRMKSK